MLWERMSEWFAGISFGGVQFGVGLFLKREVPVERTLESHDQGVHRPYQNADYKTERNGREQSDDCSHGLPPVRSLRLLPHPSADFIPFLVSAGHGVYGACQTRLVSAQSPPARTFQ